MPRKIPCQDCGKHKNSPALRCWSCHKAYLKTEDAKQKNRDIFYKKLEKYGPMRLGQSPSLETRQKISAKLKGRPLSMETRKKMSIARSGPGNPNYGKKMSEEQKAKISASKSPPF